MGKVKWYMTGPIGKRTLNRAGKENRRKDETRTRENAELLRKASKAGMKEAELVAQARNLTIKKKDSKTRLAERISEIKKMDKGQQIKDPLIDTALKPWFTMLEHGKEAEREIVIDALYHASDPRFRYIDAALKRELTRTTNHPEWNSAISTAIQALKLKRAEHQANFGTNPPAGRPLQGSRSRTRH
ncbi:MAG: hypothetical protein COV47_04080 [Candidatus Diapherotrites archaeon CG11_big_fil_rev_8_21_14_0_20_37_9]|nr:MAG: hypothetical protein COV47_04080 [Candidatus Diapherotrites archaeon CG11_big_fil_rev_8_21_14_0_20_37_9]